MEFVANFFSTYWPLILILVVVVVIVAIFRAVRRVLREGGGAFKLESARQASNPNKLWLKQISKALVADADLICQTKGELIKPTKEDMKILRVVVKKRLKVAMFIVPDREPPEVAYFFCKSESALQRRLKNLLPNTERKSHKWPYADIATGKQLKFKVE